MGHSQVSLSRVSSSIRCLAGRHCGWADDHLRFTEVIGLMLLGGPLKAPHPLLAQNKEAMH
jgi:hypothetical protein